MALVSGIAAACPAVSAAEASSTVLPVYSSKPGKNGLFPEETISMDDLYARQLARKQTLILDARGKSSYDSLHITGAALPLSADYYRAEELFRLGLIKTLPDRDKDLEASIQKYPKDTPVVAYCNDDCQASAVLVIQLKRLGFTDAKAMEGGVQSWQAKGYPVVAAKK